MVLASYFAAFYTTLPKSVCEGPHILCCPVPYGLNFTWFSLFLLLNYELTFKTTDRQTDEFAVIQFYVLYPRYVSPPFVYNYTQRDHELTPRIYIPCIDGYMYAYGCIASFATEPWKTESQTKTRRGSITTITSLPSFIWKEPFHTHTYTLSEKAVNLKFQHKS